MDVNQFQLLLISWIGIALVLFPIQLFVTAPYGRHISNRWGITIPNRLGWVVMEIVSPLVFAYFFLAGPVVKTLPMWIFFGLWVAHYFNRSILFPLRIKSSGKRIPLLIVLSAVGFNLMNGFTNGYYLGSLAPSYPVSWLGSPQFILGMLLFFTGAGINLWADEKLISLRKPGESGYKIPRGGLFNFISCPNHFGEILEWFGFALLTWNLAALGFAIWTAANLIPRAISHHRWYQQHFEDYPPARKAVFPGVV